MRRPGVFHIESGSRRRVIAGVAVACVLAGCTFAPVRDDHGAPAALPAPDTLAPPVLRGAPDEFDEDHVGALDPDAIRVLVWNVQKGGDENWIGDFRTFAADRDLVLLQEAHLHPEFVRGLAVVRHWDLAEAWRWRRAPTGVLTASDAVPLRVDSLGSREPLLRTPKSALVTEYRLAGRDATLLVANIHAINFTVDTRAFREQLLAIAGLLEDHDGPVILCGDLNTWGEERRAIVHAIAGDLALREVAFEGPRKQFRRYALDHVFYRDLEPLEADVTAVESSDHNPLRVTFRAPPPSSVAR